MNNPNALQLQLGITEVVQLQSLAEHLTLNRVPADLDLARGPAGYESLKRMLTDAEGQPGSVLAFNP